MHVQVMYVHSDGSKERLPLQKLPAFNKLVAFLSGNYSPIAILTCIMYLHRPYMLHNFDLSCA